MKRESINILMNKLFSSHWHLSLWLVSAFLLPWQTKLILKSASSNYWEISLFAVMIFLVFTLAVFFITNFKHLQSWSVAVYVKVAAILFLLSLILSLFYSLDPLLSFYRYIWLIIFVISLYAISHLPQNWRTYILVTLLLSIFFQALLGVHQFLTQLSFSSSIMGMALHDASRAGTIVLESVSGRYLRAYGPLDHPNVFGGIMALAVIVSAYLFLRINNRYQHLLFLVLFIVFNLALLTSFSRAAILAFVLAYSVFLIENRKSIKVWSILLLSSVIIILLFSWQYHELLFSRLQVNNRLEQISLNERKDFNQSAWYNFFQHPVIGTGLSNSTLVIRENDLKNQLDLAAWNYQPAHNYFLLILNEGGIILFIAVLLFWYFAYKKSRSYRLLALFVTFFILTLFDHWLFSLPLTSVLPFFWLALI